MYLEKAIQIATEAHAGQVDKEGQPYILHPLRVMMSLQGDVLRTVAVLHDVIEDTYLELPDLMSLFPDEIVYAVGCMSKQEAQSYDDYLVKVMSNEIAKVVKLADLRDNISPVRLYKLAPDTIIRLTKKYTKAIKLLEGWK